MRRLTFPRPAVDLDPQNAESESTTRDDMDIAQAIRALDEFTNSDPTSTIAQIETSLAGTTLQRMLAGNCRLWSEQSSAGPLPP